jgi:RsmE family RNA methyltransferase
VNRILLEPGEVGPDGAAELAGPRAAHLVEVLRAVPGQTVRVGVVDGPRGTACVESLDAGRVRLRCAFEAEPPPRPRVSLLLALPRPKVLKRLWAPLASLGVDRLVLVNAAKVEPNYFATHWIEPAAFRPLLLEGLQQAGDTRLPQVRVARRFRPFVEDELDALFAGAARLVADPSGPERLSGVALPAGASVLLAVGPEGGWTPFELDLLAAHGFRCVGAGPRVLRSDVACVALLAILAERLNA